MPKKMPYAASVAQVTGLGSHSIHAARLPATRRTNGGRPRTTGMVVIVRPTNLPSIEKIRADTVQPIMEYETLYTLMVIDHRDNSIIQVALASTGGWQGCTVLLNSAVLSVC